MYDQQSPRSACAYAQSDQSLCQSLEYFMNIKLVTEHHLDFLSVKGCCTGSSESTLVKMPHCWKSHVMAHICNLLIHCYQYMKKSISLSSRDITMQTLVFNHSLISLQNILTFGHASNKWYFFSGSSLQ